MRVGLVAIGRMKQGPERELVARYLDRAQAGGKSLGLSGFAVTELSESRAAAAATRTEAFAKTLGTWRDGGRGAVTFLIGGADGIDPELLKSAELTLSFSPLTWPHQLVRIMLAEQLYRATTILSGHPYHRA